MTQPDTRAVEFYEDERGKSPPPGAGETIS
jgi:hypothetical protein